MGYNYISGSDEDGYGRANIKQVLTSDPQPNQSFVGVFTTDGLATGSKSAPGSMVFSQGSDKLFIYNGTTWVSESFSTPGV